MMAWTCPRKDTSTAGTYVNLGQPLYSVHRRAYYAILLNREISTEVRSWYQDIARGSNEGCRNIVSSSLSTSIKRPSTAEARDL